MELALLLGFVTALIAVGYGARPLWVILIPSPSDATAIKAHYEGLHGSKGPGSIVLDVKRIGSRFNVHAMFRASARVYRVRLAKHDGRLATFNVAIDAVLLPESPYEVVEPSLRHK